MTSRPIAAFTLALAIALPFSAHAASVSELQAKLQSLLLQLQQLQAALRAAQSAQASATDTSSGVRLAVDFSSGNPVAHIYGLSSAVRSGLKSGTHQAYFSLVAANGSKIGIHGPLSDTYGSDGSATATLFFSNANPNAPSDVIPPGIYQLQLEVIYQKPTNTYAYGLQTVVKTTSASFPWPAGADTKTLSNLPSCTVSVTPSTGPVRVGDSITITWSSQNADKAHWFGTVNGNPAYVPGGTPKTSGSKTVTVSDYGMWPVMLEVTSGSGATADCDTSFYATPVAWGTGKFDYIWNSPTGRQIPLSGTAATESKVQVRIKEDGATKELYTSPWIPVTNGRWTHTVSAVIPKGIYVANLYNPDNGVMDTQTLVVGS